MTDTEIEKLEHILATSFFNYKGDWQRIAKDVIRAGYRPPAPEKNNTRLVSAMRELGLLFSLEFKRLNKEFPMETEQKLNAVADSILAITGDGEKLTLINDSEIEDIAMKNNYPLSAAFWVVAREIRKAQLAHDKRQLEGK